MMEVTKQSQKAGDNSTQIQAGVINNNYTLITNGVGFPVPVTEGNHHSAADKKKYNYKKDYYFSYDKIRHYLRIARRVSRNGECDKLTVLDELVLFLAQERIGDYKEVEWRLFGITKDKLDKIANDIAKPDEVVRVFSYLSDHANEVLNEYASQEDIEAFEQECDRIVRETIQANPSPVKGGDDENRPYLSMIALNMDKPHAQWEERDKIIFEHMDKPKDYAQTNIFPFEAIYFAAESSLSLFPLLKQDKEDVDIEAIMPNLRTGISMFSYRPVRTHTEPIEQAMYVLSVLAREKADKEYGEFEDSLYVDISNMAILYVKEKYHKDISKNVTDAVQALREEEHIKPLSKEQCKVSNGVIEESRQHVLWGKLFRYEKLSNEELIDVVTETCNLIRLDKTTTSFVEFVAAVINLCEIHETVFSLSDDIKEGIQRNMLRYIQQCKNREELYELNTKFCQTIDLLNAKAKGKMLYDMMDYFRGQYDEAYAINKDKMTLFLENMTDDTIEYLPIVYSGTIPDHSTSYNMTGIFQNVDIDKMYEVICKLSNDSREKFMSFIETRYLLRNRFIGNSWVAYDEELIPLRKLKQLIDNNIAQFELNDKRSMRQLSEYVEMVIKRCCGETDVLIGY